MRGALPQPSCCVPNPKPASRAEGSGVVSCGCTLWRRRWRHRHPGRTGSVCARWGNPSLVLDPIKPAGMVRGQIWHPALGMPPAAAREVFLSALGAGSCRVPLCPKPSSSSHGTVLSPQTPSQGLGCSGLNACQGSSCLLRWELTHPRSLLTPLSHMLLPGAFQGRVEVSAEACERAGLGMPSCPARSPPAAGTAASPLAAHRGFYEPGLARSPVGKHRWGAGDGNLPLTLTACREAGFSLPSRDLPPMRVSSKRELEERTHALPAQRGCLWF